MLWFAWPFVSARCSAVNTLLLDGVKVSAKAGEHGQPAKLFDVLLRRDFMFAFSSSSREVVNTEGGHVFRTIARVSARDGVALKERAHPRTCQPQWRSCHR